MTLSTSTPATPAHRPRRVSPQRPVPSDIAIAQAAKPRPIAEIAAEAGILAGELEPYGYDKAKVRLETRERLACQARGKCVVVTAITPTPLGEGKTTVTIGLSQAIGAHLGRKVFTCIRQPSMGPTFGVKGGAAGGGYSQVIPMEDFNLHLTGDTHAVAAANNLLAAAIDARLFHESRLPDDEALMRALCRSGADGALEFAPCHARRAERLKVSARTPALLEPADRRRLFRLDLDPASISWRRVLDVNDRMLRTIQIGLGAEERSPRETGFDIAVASEIMAVLALCTDLEDLRRRLQRMVVGEDRQGNPVSADDIGAAGALAALLRDAVKPNLLQTLEGTPVFVHAGPFANIAHGNSSVIADQVAQHLAEFVVTEAGFGSDIGFEKFANIKCRASGIAPSCAVMVVTVRALKMHGGGPKVVAGRPLAEAYRTENLPLLEAGLANLQRHIANVRAYGVPVVVAINTFTTDTQEEIKVVQRCALASGADAAMPVTVWADGGAGAVALGEAVIAACGKPHSFRHLYDAHDSIEGKILAIARQYGAEGVDYSPAARASIDRYTARGWGTLPICMAKTHLSLTDRPEIVGAPTGFRLTVREIRASIGAGFLYPLVGSMRTMPGLPARPAFIDVDVDPRTGLVEGLF